MGNYCIEFIYISHLRTVECMAGDEHLPPINVIYYTYTAMKAVRYDFASYRLFQNT